jgi:hypothetical protein
LQAWANTTAPSSTKPVLNWMLSRPATNCSSASRRSARGCWAEIAPFEAEKVERDERGQFAAGLGAQRDKIGMSDRAKHHRLAVDQRVIDGQGPDRLGDSRQLVNEVDCVAGPQGDAIGVLASDQPVAVLFHLMQPARPGGRTGDEVRLARYDEAGGWGAPGSGELRHGVRRLSAGTAEGVGTQRLSAMGPSS